MYSFRRIPECRSHSGYNAKSIEIKDLLASIGHLTNDIQGAHLVRVSIIFRGQEIRRD
jgi:hypothetical protein